MLCSKCGVNPAQGCRCNLGEFCKECGPHNGPTFEEALKEVGRKGAEAIYNQISDDIIKKFRV